MSYRNLVSLRFYVSFWGALVLMSMSTGWMGAVWLGVAVVNFVLSFVSEDRRA